MSSVPTTPADALLSVHGLRTIFETTHGLITAVDGIDLKVFPGEVLGIVGESGSGKSVTLRSIARLVRFPGQASGQIIWRGQDISQFTERQMTSIRGKEIGMIFQEPMTALNPVLSVGDQIRENLKEHTGLDATDRQHRTIELLDHVGIPAAADRIEDFPHQFSGGMRQRAMIAIALASSPRLLLADEPTTALDVTIQDQILKLILRLRHEMNMSVVLVTHDLGVVAETCDRVAVMYAGRIVETGSVLDIFRTPRHPYTLGLLGSVPSGAAIRKPLHAIRGSPPSLEALPAGCPFHPRCDFADGECQNDRPPLVNVGTGHHAACLHHERLPTAGETA